MHPAPLLPSADEAPGSSLNGRAAPGIGCRPLRSLDEAKALVDLVYETHGLSFYRDWMYQPDAILELNLRGAVRSLLAVEGRRVVGHAALVQPFFELQPPGAPPITDPAHAEVGLALVQPRLRGRGTGELLGAAMHRMALEHGVLGVISRCVTHTDRGQRSAGAAGGAAVGLLLGSVPEWAQADPDAGPAGQSLSSMLYYTPLSKDTALRGLSTPPGMGFVADRVAALGLRRGPPAPALEGPSALVCTWSASRRAASILVSRAGDDLAERLGQSLGWLVRGHIAHVSVYIAADTEGLERLGPALRALGLSAAGWLPRFFAGGRDAVLLQTLAWQRLDPARVVVADAGGAAVKAAVVADWGAGAAEGAVEDGRQGAVVVKLSDERAARAITPGVAGWVGRRRA